MSIEWAAGLFEGEGCISVGRQKRRVDGTPGSRYPEVALMMIDQDVVVAFAEIIGVGTVSGPIQHRAPRRKPLWRWRAVSRQGRIAINLLYPFLGERRRARADEVLRETVSR